MLLTVDRVRKGESVGSELAVRYHDDGLGLPLLVILSDWSVRKCRYRTHDVYHVEEIPSPLGRGFLLHRTPEAIERDPDRTDRYGVLISNEQDHVCECRGHLAHGRCKHVDALRSLLAAGHIDHPGERPADPVAAIGVAPF